MGAFQYGDAGECEREDSYDERERGWFLQPVNGAGPFGPENGIGYYTLYLIAHILQWGLIGGHHGHFQSRIIRKVEWAFVTS